MNSMKQKQLTYTAVQNTQFYEDENCTVAINDIKKYIRKYMSLKDCHCILISCIKNEGVSETIIMIECLEKERMNIFKISKSVTAISKQDIREILLNPCRNTPIQIRLVNTDSN